MSIDRLKELARYFTVSCVALGLDTALLLFLKHYFGMFYLLAATLSFAAGCCAAYYLSVRFVFPHSEAGLYDGVIFALLGCIGLILNAIVIWTMTDVLHASILSSKGAAAGCTFFCNYSLRRHWFMTSPRAASRRRAQMSVPSRHEPSQTVSSA